ncbi:MAG: hypothetical protein MHPSP_001112, partial [Paramarteilia canceri]
MPVKDLLKMFSDSSNMKNLNLINATCLFLINSYDANPKNILQFKHIIEKSSNELVKVLLRLKIGLENEMEVQKNLQKAIFLNPEWLNCSILEK